MGFDGACGAAPRVCAGVGVFSPPGPRGNDSWPPHCGWCSSHRGVVSVQPGKHIGLKDTHFRSAPNSCGLYCVSSEVATALPLGTCRLQLAQQMGCPWLQYFLARASLLLSLVILEARAQERRLCPSLNCVVCLSIVSHVTVLYRGETGREEVCLGQEHRAHKWIGLRLPPSGPGTTASPYPP